MEAGTCSAWSVDPVPEAMLHRHSAASAVGAKGSYMFGGYDMTGPTQVLDDLWLRTQDGAWQAINPSTSDVPPARYGHTLSPNRTAGSLVLFGGTGVDNRVLEDGWLFDTSHDTWVELSTESSPGPLTGHASIVFEDKLLIFGGTNGTQESAELWLLGSGGSWSKHSPSGTWPAARQQHSATLVQVPGESAAMIVYGGCAGEACRDVCSAPALGDVWRLDLVTMRWSQLYAPSDQGPSPRFGHSALQFGSGELAFVAGSSCSSNSSSPAELSNGAAVQLWLYAASEAQWQLSSNSQCLGPVGDGIIRPFFQLTSTAPLGALLFGNDQVFESQGDGTAPVAWSIALRPPECPDQCSGRGVCSRGSETQDFLQCECYPFSDTDGTSCGDNNYNFQWYLLYSAFGVTVLLLCFFLRRVYGCMRRRRRAPWAAPLLSEAAWGPEELQRFLGAPVELPKLCDCDICMDRQTDLQLVPCEHLLCQECACKILGAKLECPFCRGTVTGAREATQATKEEGTEPEPSEQPLLVQAPEETPEQAEP